MQAIPVTKFVQILTAQHPNSSSTFPLEKIYNSKVPCRKNRSSEESYTGTTQLPQSAYNALSALTGSEEPVL